MEDFRDFIIYEKNLTFPVHEDDFPDLILEYSTQNSTGIQQTQNNYLGFVNDDLIFASIGIYSQGNPQDPYEDKYPIYEMWEEAISNFN